MAKRRAPFNRFRPLPLVVLEDPSLKSHHVDVLIAMAEFADLSDRALKRSRVTTAQISAFTRIDASNLARWVRDLGDFGYLDFSEVDNKLVDIRWTSKRDISQALRRGQGAAWARMPVPVVHDSTLAPVERHAYAALCWLKFSLINLPDGSFFCTVSLLAEKMHVSHSTAKRVLRSLERIGLIERPAITARRWGARALRLTRPFKLYDEIRDAEPGTPKFRPSEKRLRAQAVGQGPS